jgi:hypothetical protein
MKTVTLNKLSELCIWLLLTMLPFSYPTTDVPHVLLYMVLAILIGLVVVFEKYSILSTVSWHIVLAIVFMFIFDPLEKINFIQQYNLPIKIGHRIPLATIVLSFLFLIYLVNYLKNKTLYLPCHTYTKYLFISCTFLLSLALIFYPVLYSQYNMGVKTDLLLIGRIVKYFMIFQILISYIDSQSNVKRVTIPLSISMGLSAMISLVMILIKH